MIMRLRWPALAVAVVVALAVAGSVSRGPAGTARPAAASGRSTLPVTDAATVCPDVTGSANAPTTMSVATATSALPGLHGKHVTVTSMPLGKPHPGPKPLAAHPVTRITTSGPARPTVIHATGAGAAAVAASQSRLVPHGRLRGLLSAPCLAAGTDVWIAGADGRVGYADMLVLANPGITVANVTVTAWAANGALEPPRLRSYTVLGDSAALLPVSAYTPDAANVTLHVHANTGRVTAAVVDRRISGVTAAGADWIPATRPPSTRAVVPGFVGGSGSRRLVLANPGARDATVSLRLSTPDGNFAPAGHQTVIVRAAHTALVDLTTSFGGSAGAVIAHSDEPVVASAISTETGSSARSLPDLQWQPAAVPLTGAAVLPDNTPPFGSTVRVYVTAAAGAAKVRVATLTGATRTLQVRAGRTLAWDPVAALGTAAYGPLVFTPAAGGTTYISRTLYAAGAHGPLVTAGQPVPLPRPVGLPPVEEDMRAAIR